MIDSGLAGTGRQIEALLVKVDRHLVANLSGRDLPPAGRLFVQLTEMNRIQKLRNGDVPLAQWLEAALVLAGDRTEADLFQKMLDRLS